MNLKTKKAFHSTEKENENDAREVNEVKKRHKYKK